MKYSHSTRRVVAILLSIIMIVLSFPNIVFAESKNETLKYSEVTVNVDPGDDFSIRIKLTNNTGITDAMVRVNYNTETLILESVNYGGNFSKEAMPPETLEQSIITLLWSSEKDVVSGDVIYATLNFAAKDKCAENSKETIRVAYFPYDFIYKNPDSDGLTVSVMECIPGDINHDGKVSMLDLRQLREYLNTYNIEVLNYLLTQEVESPEELAMEYLNTLTDTVALDVNHDGAFTMLDVNTLARYIAHYNGYIYYGNRFSRMCSHKNLDTILAKKPTNCAEAGNIEYWYCRDCNKYYSDWLCMDEISPEDTVVTGGAHSLEVIPAVAATCTEAGNSEYWHCTKCGKYFADADGNNEITIESTVVNPKGHTVVIDAAVSPTYDSTGLTEGSHCSVCNTVLKAQEIVDKLEPTYHSITYKDTKGAEIPADKMRYSEHEGLLDMPEISADGYKFKGWYTASEGGTKIDHITKGTTEDYVLYAHWELVKYTITYKDAPVNNNKTEFTIEDEIVLTEPEWFGLAFKNWTDENGVVVDKINKGTTGNVTITANWMSERNLAVPSNSEKSTAIFFDEESERYYFIYDLGTIENIILSTLGTDDKGAGETLKWNISETVSVENDVAKTVARTISESVSHTDGWSETRAWANSVNYSHSSSVAAGVELKAPGVTGKVEAKIEQTLSLGGTKSYEHSNSGSDSTGTETSDSVSSTVSYTNGTSTTIGKEITIPGEMPKGKYSYVCAGTAHVYAVVTYDPEERNYYVDTFSIMDDNIYEKRMYDAPANTTANISVSEGLPLDITKYIAEIEAYIGSVCFVKYNANGGEGTMNVSVHGSGYTSNLTSNKFIRNGYNFKGWATAPDGEVVYKDEAEVKDIAEKGKIITLYAVWDVNPYEIGKYVANKTTLSDTNGKRTFEVYVDSVPRFCNGEVITVIYLSKEFAEDIITDLVNETYIIGDSSATYKGKYLCFANIAEGVLRTLHLKDFNFSGEINNYSSEHEDYGACVGGDITIEVIGNCSINMSTAGSTAIKLATQNITLKGSGTLTVKGGDGADATVAGANGGNGGAGIIADNITVDMTGTLNVYGGNGGNGAAGENGRDGYNGGNSFWWSSNNGESGHDGGRGGDGGTGNLAVRSKSQILVINGTVRMYGGSSGNSGNGGNGGSGGNGSTAGAVGATGGRGGDAGRGGNSGDVTVGAPSSNCGYIISGNSGATVTSVIGDAGNIGTPGNAGNVGSGGGNGGWWGAHAGAAGSPASNGSDGRIIYDVTTAGVYNNADNGNVTHSIENGMLKITISGEAAPGLGGFVQSTSSAPYKVFYHTIVAKVPVGYKLEHASNAIGDGAHFEWMTNNSGTGEFETYVYRTTCGSTGTFNDFGYVYLYADDYTTVSYPVEWYVSYANITE